MKKKDIIKKVVLWMDENIEEENEVITEIRIIKPSPCYVEKHSLILNFDARCYEEDG